MPHPANGQYGHCRSIGALRSDGVFDIELNINTYLVMNIIKTVVLLSINLELIEQK